MMNFDKFKKIAETAPHMGELDDYDVVGEYKNSGCGDNYMIYLKLDGDRIQDISFTTTGCSFGLASLSLLAGLARGKTLDEALAIPTEEIEKGVDEFPPRRKNYLVSAKEALEIAINEAKARQATAH